MIEGLTRRGLMGLMALATTQAEVLTKAAAHFTEKAEAGVVPLDMIVGSHARAGLNVSPDYDADLANKKSVLVDMLSAMEYEDRLSVEHTDHAPFRSMGHGPKELARKQALLEGRRRDNIRRNARNLVYSADGNGFLAGLFK